MNGEWDRATSKLLNEFKSYTKTKRYTDGVRHLRQYLDLPEEGIKPDVKDGQQQDLIIFKLPKACRRLAKRNPDFRSNLALGVRWLLDEFIVNAPWYYRVLVLNYVLFNEYYYDEIWNQTPDTIRRRSLSHVIDIRETLMETVGEDDGKPIPDIFREIMSEHASDYPVAIGIHPLASQRDVIDYIKRNWAQIEAGKNQYRDESKPKRYPKTSSNERIRSRNDFLYRNRDRPRKELSRLLRDETGEILDQGHISKIISLERARREQE